MASDRQTRLALNEAAFRVANERMREWPERADSTRTERFYCECAHSECREHVLLSGAQYEAVRADSRHFVLLPGHQTLDVEHVIETAEGYIIVEKDESVAHLVEKTDPRR